MDGEEKGRIEGLNDTLYSRTRYRDPLDKRTAVKDLDGSPVVEDKWQTPALDEMLRHERIAKPINPFVKKVFVFALLFFMATIIVAGFVFMGGANFISSRNVDINVLGPTSVSAGEVLELGVSVSNTNNADLEIANLSIQYPQGTRNPDNTAEPMTYTKNELGVVKAGNEAVQNVRAVIFGASGEIKEIKFSVEYKVKGSNATFYKDKVFEIIIGDAPLTLSVDSPESVTSGDTFTTIVSVTLNSTEVLKDVVLKAEYPYGYSVLDASPKSISDDNVWALGDLSPGDKKTISIRGRLVGQNAEERTFRFYVGVSDSDSFSPTLKIIMVSLLNTIAVDRPSIGLSTTLNGEEATTYLAPAARPIATVIRFQNNLPDKLLNPHLEVRLSGVALDKASVQAGNNGVYDANNSKVVWNLTNNLGNSELLPGEYGQVSFNFASLPSTALTGTNNDITLNFSLSGTPIGTVGQQPLAVSEVRTVKIASQVNLSSKALRSLGSFANTGPVPPKVGQETSYTIVFNVRNTQGDLADTKVTARLGPGVTLINNSLGTEDVVYDSLTNNITWDIGNLSSGSGFSSDARELAFQVSLKPVISQIGSVPVLVNSIIFSGRDALTGNMTNINNSPLTTRLLSDPAFIQGDEVVTK